MRFPPRRRSVREARILARAGRTGERERAAPPSGRALVHAAARIPIRRPHPFPQPLCSRHPDGRRDPSPDRDARPAEVAGRDAVRRRILTCVRMTARGEASAATADGGDGGRLSERGRLDRRRAGVQLSVQMREDSMDHVS